MKIHLYFLSMIFVFDQMEMAASTSDGEQQSPQPEDGVMNNDQGYTKELASHLNQLRHENTLCDVTIIIGQRRFQAHKVVLCATSSYFSAMFTGSFHESSQSEVTIPEGSRVAFEKLLDFAYTGGLLLSTTTITDIISMACYMQFNRAIPLCALFLRQSYVRKSIQPQDAFTILNMANSHQLFLIEESARDYLASRFVEFCEMSCFLEEVSAEYVESVLGRKDLGLWATEEQVRIAGLFKLFFLTTQISASKSYTTPKQKKTLPYQSYIVRGVCLLIFTDLIEVLSYFECSQRCRFVVAILGTFVYAIYQ